MKKSFIIPIFLAVIIFSISLLIKNKNNTITKFPQPDEITLEEVSPEARDTQYMLNHLFRGEIIEQTDNSITIKEDLFATSGQEIKFMVSPSEEVFCWQSKQNGIDIRQSLLTLSEGSTLYMKNELKTIFANLPNIIDRYTLIQIDDQGAIKKLVILSCFND